MGCGMILLELINLADLVHASADAVVLQLCITLCGWQLRGHWIEVDQGSLVCLSLV
jgi:hypothetical protein